MTNSAKVVWRSLKRTALTVCLLSILSASPAAFAQSTGAPTMDADATARLLNRIDELERKAKRVDQLEIELRALKANTPAPETPTALPTESYPQIRMNILADITFHTSSAHDEFNTFALGDIDSLITAKLSEKAGVLLDFVVASNHGSFEFEIERLVFQYSFNDHFNIEAGRFHTAIGYYNNTYHNGTYFQTTVDRPEIYDFEDGGGILPVHSNGLSLNGEIPSGSLRLRYVAEIANGRNYGADSHFFSIEDDNPYKALNFALSAKPESVPGLQLGASFYHDTVTPKGLPRIQQSIASGYVVYKTPTFEWFNEAVFMRNTPQGQPSFTTSAFYTQYSHKFGAFRPYLRLQWRDSPEGDPLLALIEANARVWGPTAGIRYDFTPMMVLKLEYERTERRHESSVDESTLQWAIRF